MNYYFIFALNYLEPAILIYFAFLNSVYFCLLMGACFKVFFREREREAEEVWPFLKSDSLPEITFIVPVFNGADVIIETVQHILNLSYRYKKIIVINDGSSDDTVALLYTAFDVQQLPYPFDAKIPTQKIVKYGQSKTFPHLFVIDAVHGTKGEALNSAINTVDTPYFIESDDDTFIEDGYVNALIRNLLTHPDTVVSGGGVRILNDCKINFNTISTEGFPKTLLPGIQAIEYLRAFTMGRLGWQVLKGNLIMSGAFALFQTQAVRDVGGYVRNNPAEDMDIIVRVHKYMCENNRPYNVTFFPDPAAWTRCPDTFQQLKKQRQTWHRGITQCLWEYRSLFMNPKYGRVGLVIVPFFVLCEIMAPIVEMTAYILVVLSFIFAAPQALGLLYIVVACWGLVFLMSLTSLLLEEISFRRYSSTSTFIKLALCAALENLGYRQLTVWWRIQGIAQYFFRLLKTKIRHLRPA